MKLRRLVDSLVTRIVAFVVLVVVLGAVGRYFFLARSIRTDLIEVVSGQQLALAEAIARDIDYKVAERQRFLQHLAATMPQELLARPDQLRAWLDTRLSLLPLFSQGVIVLDLDGKILTDSPQLPGRAGSAIPDNLDFIAGRAGRLDIGHPVMSRLTHTAVMPFQVPVTATNGRVVAVLIGASALNAPEFLDRIQRGKIGKTGGFSLISPRDKLIILSTDASVVLKPTPPPGRNLLFDRAMNGFRGTGVTINSNGIEQITATVSVPSTGWYVVARIPTAEALAALDETRSFIVRYGLIEMIMLALILGFLVTRILKPLYHAADQARKMTVGLLPLTPLPVIRHDEIGRMTMAFNRLLVKLAKIQAELEQIAHFDVLTGLLNRSLLTDRIEQALSRVHRNGNFVALLFLDLDGFKKINDTLGHETGDLVLKEIAHRLRQLVRETDTLARVGGDEFVLLIPDLADITDGCIERLTQKIIDAVSQPYQFGNITCSVGASVGIAFSGGRSTPDRLLLSADKAMYDAKKNGRGCFIRAPFQEAEITSLQNVQ